MGPKFGMMAGCQELANRVVWSMHTPSPAFVPEPLCKVCSVIRTRGWSPWFVGEKNDLRRMWHGSPRLVRPYAATGSGPALRPVPDLPGPGSAAGRLPSVREGEARAAGVPAGERAAHRALCPLCRAPLPHRHDQGHRQGDESRLADGQAPGGALHADAARTRPQAQSPGAGDRRDLHPQGSRLSHCGQRPASAATDLVRRGRSLRDRAWTSSTGFSGKRRPAGCVLR